MGFLSQLAERFKYDADGFDANGYDREGYDKSGFNSEGYDRNGYDKSGFDSEGYDRNGYDKNGFGRTGYNRSGYNKQGYNRNGYDKDGFDINGFDISGKYHGTSIYDEKGYDCKGLDRAGYDKDGRKFGRNEYGLLDTDYVTDEEMEVLKNYRAKAISVYQIPRRILSPTVVKALLYMNHNAALGLPEDIKNNEEIKRVIMEVKKRKTVYSLSKDENENSSWDGVWGKADSSSYDSPGADLYDQVFYIGDHMG